MDIVYSGNESSKHSGMKKRTQPVSEIQQRVLSARMLRFKTMKNQLTLAQNRIHDLEQENRSLKTTIRRQEKALDKYDNANAELPRLLKNHQEEIRIWNEKYKSLQKKVQELANSLKHRDQSLLLLTDQNKHLQQLNRDKHLEEREKLLERAKELELQIVGRDNEIKLLVRKHQLDTKSLRVQLHQELCKCRELQFKLDKSTMEITRLNLLELEQSRSTLMRYHRHNLRESHSASTNLSYVYRPQYGLQKSAETSHLAVQSCSNSYYSRSPQCDSFRQEILYEDNDQETIEQNISLEEQRAIHLEQSKQAEEDKEKEVEETEKENESLPSEHNPEDLIEQFESLNRKDIVEKEAILDKICDSIVQDSSNSSSPKIQRVKVDKAKQEKSPEHGKKKPTIDPKNKTKLLAALKAIDDSFDKD